MIEQNMGAATFQPEAVVPECPKVVAETDENAVLVEEAQPEGLDVFVPLEFQNDWLNNFP